MIKVYNLDGGNLSTIRYHDGFMGQRIGPISCLEFHPHRVSRLTPFSSCVTLQNHIYFTVALSSDGVNCVTREEKVLGFLRQ